MLEYFGEDLGIESELEDLNEWYNDFDEFISINFENRPVDAVNCAIYGNYNPQDDYIRFDGYGNFETCTAGELEKEIETLYKNNKEQLIRLVIKEGYTEEAEQFRDLKEYINELEKPYLQLKEEQRAEQNNLPYGFAFSNKQFDAMMEKWGLNPEKDIDKIVAIGCGGYIQKKDFEKIKEKNEEQDKKMDKLLKIASNLFGALVYEMGNHELIYNYDLEFDICNCFGWTEKQLEKIKGVYKLAYQVEYNFEKMYI